MREPKIGPSGMAAAVAEEHPWDGAGKDITGCDV